MSKICLVTQTWDAISKLRKYVIPSVLNQTYQDFKWYIVQDGYRANYSEKLQQVVDSFNDDRIELITIVRQMPEPPFEIGSGMWNYAGAHALNKGLELIKRNYPDCKYIAHIDDDDWWAPNHLEHCHNVMEDNKHKVDLVYAPTDQHLSDHYGMEYDRQYNRKNLENANFIPHSSILYKLDCDHDYYYATNGEVPVDWRHLLSFKGDFMNTNMKTVLYFQRCSVDYALQKIKEFK